MTMYWAFVGSKEPGVGITVCHFNDETGALVAVHQYADIQNPHFLTLTKNGEFLYSLIETDIYEGKKSGGVAAFKFDSKTGELTLLNQRASEGSHPCHLSLNHSEDLIFVSNYSGGNAVVLKTLPDGELGELVQVINYNGASHSHPNQNQPRPHSAILAPDKKTIFLQDLGTDTIHVYSILNSGNVEEQISLQKKLPAGSGPRHLVFHPYLPLAYVLNELNSTVAVFNYQTISPQDFQQIIFTLPADFPVEENSAAEIYITKNGQFLYATNRGHDSIAIFELDTGTGDMKLIRCQSALGKHPRYFAVSHDERFVWVSNRDTNNIVGFNLDIKTGELGPNGFNMDIPKPMHVLVSTKMVG